MRKMFSLLAVALTSAMSFGAPALPRRIDPVVVAPPTEVRDGKGKGKGKRARSAKKPARWSSSKHFPFSSTRQNRPKWRMAVVNGFPIMQRLSRREQLASELRMAA